MVINLLPENMCGMDTDDVLSYSTPKIVCIRDRYVGFFYYCLTALAMCWVLGGQVLWRNEHFQLKDVKGTARMFISHPTLNQCDANAVGCLADFKSLSTLPYCNEHEGGPKVAHPAHCIYSDKHSMFADGTVGSQVFIPTSVLVIEETKGCRPSAENKHSCDNEYVKTSKDKDDYFNETKMQFYANVEDYTIQFTTTYHREHISGTSLDHPGYYTECFDNNPHVGDDPVAWKDRTEKPCKDEKRMPVTCMPGLACNKGGLKTIKAPKLKIKGLSGKDLEDMTKPAGDIVDSAKEDVEGSFLELSHGASMAGVSTSRRALPRLRTGQTPRGSFLASGGDEDTDSEEDADEVEHRRETPDVYASTWGDTFKLGKLMQLANVNLDKHLNMDDYTTRMAGTIVEVEATYSNLQKFLSSLGMSQVQYTYRAKERKLPYVSKESLHPNQPEDYPRTRRYLVQHGVLLDFKVGGEFGFFSIVYLLIMLTTSMALLATAHKITDLTALYLHPRRKNYFHLKYDVSADFSDMWMCPTCGYYNQADQDTCEGLERWESKIDTALCGCERPTDWVDVGKQEMRRASMREGEEIRSASMREGDH